MGISFFIWPKTTIFRVNMFLGKSWVHRPLYPNCPFEFGGGPLNVTHVLGDQPLVWGTSQLFPMFGVFPFFSKQLTHQESQQELTLPKFNSEFAPDKLPANQKGSSSFATIFQG